MDPRVAELLARLESLTDISDDDLASLEAEIRSLYEELRDGDLDATAVDALGQLADGLDSISAENGRREEERSELARTVEGLDARISGEVPTPEGDEAEALEAETDAAAAEADEVIDAEIEDDEPAGEPALVASTRGVARVRIPRQARAVATPDGATMGVALRAAPDLPDRPAGAQFADWDDVAQAMVQRLGTFRGSHAGPTQNVPVGRLTWERPPERTLSIDNAILNQRRIMDVVSPRAVVASGGICGPLPVRYGVDVDVTAARPVRDSLPSFTADRGGMQYQAPVGIGDVDVDGADGAIGAITAANDAAAVEKTIWCIPCSTTLNATVEAIYERLCFSNFSDRYNPENMRAYQEVARAAWARLAERRLLAAMRALATNVTAGALTVNTVRTLKHQAAYLRSWFRDRYRLPDAVGLVGYLPRWVLEAMTVDMSWQAPGDDALMFTNAEVQAAVGVHGLRIVWTLESDVSGDDLTGVTAPVFEFPADVAMLVFPEGGFTFLDGGTLDFGIVRDSTTNTLNRFETFFESFEAVAKTGYTGFNVTLPLCLNGAAAALTAQSCANTPA